MTLDNFLKFLIRYNTLITEWTIIAILVLAGYLLIANIFAKRAANALAGASPDLNEIEKALKKVLEHTALKTVTSPEAIAAAGDGGSLTTDPTSAGATAPALAATQLAELEQIKKDLAQKEVEVTELKKAAAGGAAVGAAESEKFMTQIKELESKLAEYEIIEDDIADLSKFREENTRLKQEISELRKGGANVTVPDPSAPAGDLVAEFAEALEKQAPGDIKPVVDTAPEPIEAPAAESAPIDDLGVSADELEKALAAVEAQHAAQAGPVPETPVLTSEPDVELEASPVAIPEEQPASDPDDIMAEFALDTEKMMAELSGMPEGSGDDSLEEDMDVDKMAAEADRLSNKS